MRTLCVFAPVVADSFPWLSFCVLVEPSGCDGTVVPLPPATVETPLSERPLFYAGSGGSCAVTRLWKSYYCFNLFWNLTLGWACSTVFIVMCREDCFCVHYVKKFLFLVAIMSFNLWETNVKKKKKKLKRWDQIKVNNVTPCDLILGRCDCNRTLIFISLRWFNSYSASSFIRPVYMTVKIWSLSGLCSERIMHATM